MKEFELEPGEVVIQEVRKHWFVFVVELLPFAILALFPLAIPKFFVIGGAPASLLAFSSSPYVSVALALWWLLIWTAAFNSFTRYYLNLWVLTNERIVDIHQRGFFNREVSSLLLNRVQDITVDTVGLLPSLLDIGTINVQTAGAEERFTMRGIPEPALLRDRILKNVSEHPIPTAPQAV